MENLLTFIDDYKVPIDNIRSTLQAYIERHHLKSLVLGISGGIDSTACAVLAKPVCDYVGIPLIGRSISIEGNKEDEILRAKGIGWEFCDDFAEINLSDMFRTIRNEIDGYPPKESNFDHKIRWGNIKARMRMMYLYNLSSLHKGMVLSTDNYTELLAGFWTLHGDVGDYGMIQNLWKTEVYGMMNYIASNLDKNDQKYKVKLNILGQCINANPTDGLGITNSDLDQLGTKSYEEADILFIDYFKKLIEARTSEEIGDIDTHVKLGEEIAELEKHKLIQRYLKSEFKRNNPLNIPRNVILGKY